MTGVYAQLGTMSPPSAAQYNTLRFLAQLSVNIVDYIDTDDVMTAFQWVPVANVQPPDTTGIVFGTELPKLVVNEVYFQYNNDPTDPFPKNAMGVQAASKPYQMNVWAELVNPLPSGADANGGNQAVLQDANGKAVYQLVLTKPNQGVRNPDNTLGSPDGPTPPSAPYATQNPPSGQYTASGQYQSVGGSQVLQVVSNWGASPQAVAPMGGNYGNGVNATAGFFVVGPQTTGPAVQGLPAATFQSPNMTYTVNFDPTKEATANAPVADPHVAAAGEPESAVEQHARRQLQPLRHGRLRRSQSSGTGRIALHQPGRQRRPNLQLRWADRRRRHAAVQGLCFFRPQRAIRFGLRVPVQHPVAEAAAQRGEHGRSPNQLLPAERERQHARTQQRHAAGLHPADELSGLPLAHAPGPAGDQPGGAGPRLRVQAA